MTNFLFFTTPTVDTINTNSESVLFTCIVIVMVIAITLKIIIDTKKLK